MNELDTQEYTRHELNKVLSRTRVLFLSLWIRKGYQPMGEIL